MKASLLKVVKLLHWLYKATLSPFLGNCCRFEPTCSDYALEALEQCGLIRGGLLALRRIARCNPWCRGGFDPVQEYKQDFTES